MAPELLLPQDELAALRAKLGAGTVSDVCEEAAARVESYTALYALTAEHRRALIRPLARRELLGLAGAVPEGVQTDFERAVKELQEIRDGKMTGLEPAGAGDGPAVKQKGLEFTRQAQEGL